MPTYTAQCPSCGHEQDYVRAIADRDDVPLCERCKSPTKKILAPTRIRADMPDYLSPVDGRIVHGRAGRREDLIRSNCREWEGRESEERAAKTVRDRQDKALDARIDEQLSASYEGMSTESKLALEHLSIDINTERQ